MLFKNILKIVYIKIITLIVVLRGLLKNNNSSLKIFYGGALSGSNGGPLVKILRLKEYFPQHKLRFNIVYALSNAPYLSTFAQTLLKKNNIPLIVNQNGVYFPGWFDGDCNRMNKNNASLYHNAEYVFWQSKFCRKSANLYLGNREGPGEVLYNAVDLSVFKPSHIKSNKNFTFLITGKFDNKSSYRVLNALEGFRLFNEKVKDSKLIIAGIVPKALLKKCNFLLSKYSLQSSVSLLGKYNQDLAPQIYASAHSYLHLKYMDPCPNTMIEAMSCGLPVISTNSGGCLELVSNKTGYLIDVKSSYMDFFQGIEPHLILKGMFYVYNNRNKLSKASRVFAENNFDINCWINRHKYIFSRYLP